MQCAPGTRPSCEKRVAIANTSIIWHRRHSASQSTSIRRAQLHKHAQSPSTRRAQAYARAVNTRLCQVPIVNPSLADLSQQQGTHGSQAATTHLRPCGPSLISPSA